MADVHIVCVREDELKAKVLAEMFEAAGFSVGGAVTSDDAVRSIGAVVVVWSPGSVRSIPFLDAARRVISSGKAIVASLTEPPPPASIDNAPAFDLSGWSGDRDDPALDPLFFAVDRMVKALSASAPPAPPFAILGDVPLLPPKPPFGDGSLPVRKPAPTPTPPKPAATPPNRPDSVGSEAERWREIRDSTDPAKFMDYLAKYGPAGAFAEIAELRLRQLTGSTPTPSPVAKPPLVVSRPTPAAVTRPTSPAPIKPARKQERHIFLSHASEADGRRALKLLTALEAAGCRCWMAPRDIPAGADWNKSVLNAVENSAALLLLLSSAAVKSAFVQAEVHRAFDRGIRVVQVLLAANVDPAPIDMRLLRVQRITASGDDKALAQSILAAIN